MALDHLARQHRSDEGPAIEVRVDGDPRRLSADAELALLRVAQEAINNARRHARANRVVVTLTYQPTAARLDVVDDGVGLHPAHRQRRGFGLASMRSRVEQLGGTFIVESTPTEGVAVNAVLPVPSNDAEVSA